MACEGSSVNEPLIALVVGVPGRPRAPSTSSRQAVRPAGCIEGDLIQHLLTVSGFGHAAETSPESDRQLQLRWRNCADLARNFWRFGFTAVVEQAASGRRRIDQFVNETGPAPVSLIVLVPTAEVAPARDGARPDKPRRTVDGAVTSAAT